MTTILDALTDANLFKGSVGRMAMDTWRAFLVALFGLPLSDDMASIFRSCTGRTTGPSSSFVEAWLICGRRAGKSFMMALIAVFLACFRSYTDYLGPGERGTIMVIAADRKQARATLRFIAGLLAVPMLKKLVERETAESFDLSNRVTIEVATANYRTVRGYTIVAALCDEVAFWPWRFCTKPSPPTRPSWMQRARTVSNRRRRRSLSRNRPWRFFENVEWSGTRPSRPSRQNQR